MDNYKIYVHIFPNYKRYIGITQQELNKRWKNGLGYETQKLIFKAIKKYGWDNIKHEVLFENLCEQEALQKEIELIELYKTTDSKYGYNVLDGGGFTFKKHSNETKIKMSMLKMGKGTSKCICIETQEKFDSVGEAAKQFDIPYETISRSCQGRQVYVKGYRFSYLNDDGTYKINKIKPRQTKEKYGKYGNVRIQCIETGEIFDSVNEANVKYNIKSKSTISNVLRGRNNTAYGYHWIYAD